MKSGSKAQRRKQGLRALHGSTAAQHWGGEDSLQGGEGPLECLEKVKYVQRQVFSESGRGQGWDAERAAEPRLQRAVSHGCQERGAKDFPQPERGPEAALLGPKAPSIVSISPLRTTSETDSSQVGWNYRSEPTALTPTRTTSAFRPSASQRVSALGFRLKL